MATFGVHSCKITWLTFFLYPFSVSTLRTLCKPVFMHTTMACANTHTHAQYNRMQQFILPIGKKNSSVTMCPYTIPCGYRSHNNHIVCLSYNSLLQDSLPHCERIPCPEVRPCNENDTVEDLILCCPTCNRSKFTTLTIILLRINTLDACALHTCVLYSAQ